MNDFRHQLSDFADRIEITDGSASSAAAKARRRTRLTVAARLGAVALVATGGVVGVRALSSTELAGEPIDAPDGVASAESTVPSPSTAPTDPKGTVAAVAGDGSEQSNDDWLASAPQTRAAQFVPLDYTWTAVPTDSPEAVALKFRADEKYAVSTSDGVRDGMMPQALYEQTADGWELVEKIDEGRYVSSSAIVGDTIYLVLNNIDSDSEDPSLRAFDFAARTWSDVALPEGWQHTAPSGSKLAGYPDIEVTARDGTLTMLAETWFDIDLDKLNMGEIEMEPADSRDSVRIADRSCLESIEPGQDFDESNRPYAASIAPTTMPPADSDLPDASVPTEGSVLADGSQTPAPSAGPSVSSGSDPAPVPDSVIDTAPSDSAITATTLATSATVAAGTVAPPGVDPYQSCFRTVSLDELGLSAEDKELLLNSPSSMWTLDGAQWAQHDLPGSDASTYTLFDGGVLMMTEADGPAVSEPVGSIYGVPLSTTYHEVHADGSVTPLFDGHEFAQPGSANAGPPASRGRAVTTSGAYVLDQDLQSGAWNATDLNTLGAEVGWGRYEAYLDAETIGVDGSVIATASVATHLPDETTELTSGQYTLRFPTSSNERETLIDNATGKPVDEFFVSTEAGRIKVIRPSKTYDSEETVAEFDTDWTTIPFLNIKTQSALFLSDDGVHFGAIDGPGIAKAAGIQFEETDSIHFQNPVKRDGQVFLSGWVAPPDADGESYIFIGTPN